MTQDSTLQPSSSGMPGPAPELLYGLNDRPPAGRLFLYALQWLLIFLPMLTLFSILIADVTGLEPELKTALFQRLLIVTGVTMIVQTLWGHQLPLIDGPATALVITYAALSAEDPSIISGGMIAGGMMIFIVGIMGWMKYLSPLFTDRVVGVILLLIGLTILPFLLPMLTGSSSEHPNGRPLFLAAGMGLALIIAMMSHYLKGLAQSLSVFWGLGLGAVVFGLLGWMDCSAVKTAPWFQVPDPAWGSLPSLNIGAGLSFALAYLAVLVNAAGSFFSVQPIVQADRMDRRVKRGLAVTGLAGILSGGAGVVGTVPYALSPGIITVTRVGSRFPLALCGALLVVLAFLGKVAALLSSIPKTVVAAALLAAVAAATGVSVNIIHGAQGLKSRECLVVGLPLLAGTLTSLMPQALLDQIPSSIRPLAGNGLIVGVVLVLILEHVLLKKSK